MCDSVWGKNRFQERSAQIICLNLEYMFNMQLFFIYVFDVFIYQENIFILMYFECILVICFSILLKECF